MTNQKMFNECMGIAVNNDKNKLISQRNKKIIKFLKILFIITTNNQYQQISCLVKLNVS